MNNENGGDVTPYCRVRCTPSFYLSCGLGLGLAKKIALELASRPCLVGGLDVVTTMKLGGWKNVKSFQHYIRLAGVDVCGATDVLDLLPDSTVPMVLSFPGSKLI